MRQLNHMNRAETSLSQEVGPIFLRVLIVDPILEIIWEQILQFNRGRESYSHVRINAESRLAGNSYRVSKYIPRKWIGLVIAGVHLEVKWRSLLITLPFASHSHRWSLQKVPPP